MKMGCPLLAYNENSSSLKVVYSSNLAIEKTAREVFIFNRKNSAGAYRYGYQGSERDDEIKGGGNSYTTHFRQLDPRLGRWLSIDPKTNELPWESPYVSMGNTPIWANDPMGDKFKKQKHKEKLEKKIGERKNEIQVNIDAIESKIEDLNKQLNLAVSTPGDNSDLTMSLLGDKASLDFSLETQKGFLKEMNTALYEIKEMDKSEVLFDTRRKLNFKSQSGFTDSKNGGNKEVLIKFGSYKTAIHEFHHGYQFLSGDLTFDLIDSKGAGAYDMGDEYNAYKRDYAFSPSKVIKEFEIFRAYKAKTIWKDINHNIDNSDVNTHIKISKKDRVP